MNNVQENTAVEIPLVENITSRYRKSIIGIKALMTKEVTNLSQESRSLLIDKIKIQVYFTLYCFNLSVLWKKSRDKLAIREGIFIWAN